MQSWQLAGEVVDDPEMHNPFDENSPAPNGFVSHKFGNEHWAKKKLVTWRLMV